MWQQEPDRRLDFVSTCPDVTGRTGRRRPHEGTQTYSQAHLQGLDMSVLSELCANSSSACVDEALLELLVGRRMLDIPFEEGHLYPVSAHSHILETVHYSLEGALCGGNSRSAQYAGYGLTHRTSLPVQSGSGLHEAVFARLQCAHFRYLINENIELQLYMILDI